METLNYIRIGAGRTAKPQEIVLLTADVNYTIVHFLNGRKMMVAITLKEFEKRFLKYTAFFRTHKSYLINLAHILQCDAIDNEVFVQMKNNYRVAVSRRRKAAFMKRLSLVTES